MPLLGSRCSWLKPGETLLVPTQECLACASTGTNPCGYPLPFVRLMLRDRDPNKVHCSASMLDGCPREHGIKKWQGYYVNPDEAWTRAFGSTIHLAAELTHRPGNEAMVEERLSRTHILPDGRQVMVTGQLDAAYLDGGAYHIQDYKVVDTLAPSVLKRKVAHYIPQLSIQRWLMEGTANPVSCVELVFLSHKGRRVVNLYPEGDTDFPDAKLFTLEETEQYLDERLPALADSLAGHFANPLPAEQGWRCQRCDVRRECTALYGGPIPGLGGPHGRQDSAS